MDKARVITTVHHRALYRPALVDRNSFRIYPKNYKC
jgi:hypothetical protein